MIHSMFNSRDLSDERRRVLLVDDRNSARDYVYTLLESDGYEVLAARNGPEGLTIFHRSLRPVDLLVTDCDMPGMTGLELARACARRNRNVGVLFMSGSGPDEELKADIAAFRRAFLLKPFRGDELLRKVRELFVPGFDPEPVPAPPGLHLVTQTVPLNLKIAWYKETD
jgi:CheY-like chemotaxis protein